MTTLSVSPSSESCRSLRLPASRPGMPKSMPDSDESRLTIGGAVWLRRWGFGGSRRSTRGGGGSGLRSTANSEVWTRSCDSGPSARRLIISSVPMTTAEPSSMNSRPDSIGVNRLLRFSWVTVVFIAVPPAARSARAGFVHGGHADVLRTGPAGLVDDLDQSAGRDLVVGHDQHRRLAGRGQQVTQATLDDPDPDRLAVQVGVAAVVDVQTDRLGRSHGRGRRARAIQVELHVLDEGRRDHEEDQQDEDHVDQRRDVDALLGVGAFSESHAVFASSCSAQIRSLTWASSVRRCSALRSSRPPTTSPGMATARPIWVVNNAWEIPPAMPPD